MTTSVNPMRVRQILASMTTPQRTELKKLLPKGLKMPTAATERYPSALLSALPAGENYSLLGCIAEEMLRLPVTDITVDALLTATKRWAPATDIAKVRKSKTTEPFVESLRATRTALEGVLRAADGPLVYEEPVLKDAVVGHPDMRNGTQVFEVKLTGTLKANWAAFLFQVFAYGALLPTATDLYLVLPLQRTVWHADVRAWSGRAAFRLFLTAVQEALGAFLVGVHMDTPEEGRRADLLGAHLMRQGRLGTVAVGSVEEIREILSGQREFVSQARWSAIRRNAARAASPPRTIPKPAIPPPPARSHVMIPPPPRSSILPHVGSPSRSSNEKELLNWRRKWLAGERNAARNATRINQWRRMRSRLTANQRLAQNRSLRRI